MSKENCIRCKLTGTLGPSVKAHIIPKSFYEFSDTNPGPAYILRVDREGSRRNKSPKGEYDSSIVTVEGERLFSEFDDYAARFLIRRGQEITVHHDGETILAISIGDYDYRKLKMFFVSLLWRASASKRPFFEKVQLTSAAEEGLRRRIVNGDPGGRDDLPVILAIHSDTPTDVGLPLLAPEIRTLGESTFVRFYLRFFVAYVCIDRKDSDGIFDLAMTDGQPLVALVLSPFRESSTGAATIEALRRANPQSS